MNRFRKMGINALESLMLSDAIEAITHANKWNWIRHYTGHFMYCDLPELQTIAFYMNYPGHSGPSFAWTMRQMQFIARNGLSAFQDHHKPMDWVEFKDAVGTDAELYETGNLTFAKFNELCG